MDPRSPELQGSLAVHIIQVLRERGHQAYLVGGCVRDRLLGIPPKDFDVSTDATPPQILSYFPLAKPVGVHFGVVLIHNSEGAAVEVATFRSEGIYSDGRRPDEVRFERDPALDARRRDFTINGLMEDPISGHVLDFVGGKADLQNQSIRAIGDAHQRFEEDHLRTLRAVRFAARLRFSIDSETAQAIRDSAPSIHRISAERIRDELTRILTEGETRTGFELLDSCGLLVELLPEIKALQGVEQPPQFHPEGDVWTHVLLMLEQMRHPRPTLALGVLFHDVGKPPTFRVADRIRFDGHAELGASMTRSRLTQMRFSNEDIELVTALVANHMKFKDLPQMRTSTLKRFLRMPHFEEHLELHRLDCLASNGFTETYQLAVKKLGELGEETLNPPRLISGHDLIRAGHKPGPEFGRVLRFLETAQLEGEIASHADAMELAESLLVPVPRDQ